ncbi:MAG: hypothetical protein LBL66_11315 [Clostridiales bacterium]|jgi:hypothetical protein|nr:hypothetical protein [Clostridiales bacterium]
MREYIRKKTVYLKRRPQVIPLAFIVLSCAVFTFKLSAHSDSVMRFSSTAIALCMFIVTLSSFMAVVSYLGFKKYDKSAIVPLAITLILLLLQAALQINYLRTVHAETKTIAIPIEVTPDITSSVAWTYVHLVFLGLTLLSLALLPVYRGLLQKINTAPKGPDGARP